MERKRRKKRRSINAKDKDMKYGDHHGNWIHCKKLEGIENSKLRDWNKNEMVFLCWTSLKSFPSLYLFYPLTTLSCLLLNFKLGHLIIWFIFLDQQQRCFGVNQTRCPTIDGYIFYFLLLNWHPTLTHTYKRQYKGILWLLRNNV